MAIAFQHLENPLEPLKKGCISSPTEIVKQVQSFYFGLLMFRLSYSIELSGIASVSAIRELAY